MPHSRSSTVEQYIKCIFLVAQYGVGGFVSMHAIAKEMGVAASTATAMMKRLEEEGLVDYTQRKGVILTAAGEELAVRILRRHRLIETFLAQVLKYDQNEVHADAEHLEHAVSDTFIDKISAYMGHPTMDPHGSPIPAKSGWVNVHEYTSLEQGEIGNTYEIKKITPGDADIIEELAKNSLHVGTLIKILKKNRQLDLVTVELVPEHYTVSIGSRLAPLLLLHKRETQDT